jgi:hypothetical protein
MDADVSTPLEQFTALLGEDVFFVPCEWGTKKPRHTYKFRPFASTKSAAYAELFTLQPTNIAVYLGQASGGLCAIDFDVDADLDAFLAANPLLQQTTRSRGSRGAMLWVRIEGRFPRSCKTDHFEWRADGNLATIHGRHKNGVDYRLLVDAPPLTLAFTDIQWPPEWAPSWVYEDAEAIAAALMQEYGQPFYTNKESKVTGINERYWAGLYARENRVLYEPDEKSFYLYDEGRGLWQLVTQEAIREAISQRILEVSRESRQFTLEIQITQTKLKAIVSALMGIVENRGAFKVKQRFIHVANGVLRFADDGDIQFGGFSPEDHSRNQSPFAFEAEAECPRFINELIRPAVSPDDADLLQRWAGLALFGYNLPQRFLILDHPGAGRHGEHISTADGVPE